MFVTTFYSFKGGVGRTLALVNIAARLAQQGRRVLMVDFDLEAPGIDTFKHFAAPDEQLGLVDYVTTYIKEKQPPQSVRDYVYEADIDLSAENLPSQRAGRPQAVSTPGDSGKLFVMSAGRQDDDYKNKLAAINWHKLYEEQNGYLLFENLKKQWEQEFDLDYVLIDSRTGYTEVSGICTRQLPNLVILLFILNKQNIRGIRQMVNRMDEDQKNKEDRPRNSKRIYKHFVASNVPNIDDEDDVIDRQVRRLRADFELRHRNLSYIYRYESLDLLSQSIFTVDRPKTKLAKEYGQLCARIIETNLDDPEGAINWFEAMSNPRRMHSDLLDHRQEVLENLDAKFENNVDVLIAAGKYFESCSDLAKAKNVYERSSNLLEARMGDVGNKSDQAVTQNSSHSLEPLKFHLMLNPEPETRAASHQPQSHLLQKLHEARTSLAEVYIQDQGNEEQREKATKLIEQVSQSPALDARQAKKLVNLWQKISKEPLYGLYGNKTLLNNLSNNAMLFLISDMDGSREWQALASQLLHMKIQQSDNKIADYPLMEEFIAAAIGSGKRDAVQVCLNDKNADLKLSDYNPRHEFNISMAQWMINGEPPRERLAKFIDYMLEHETEHQNANAIQCISLACYVTKQFKEAERLAATAQKSNKESKSVVFSCWQYLSVSPRRFFYDLEEMRRMRDDDILPQFIKDSD